MVFAQCGDASVSHVGAAAAAADGVDAAEERDGFVNADGMGEGSWENLQNVPS